MDIKRGELYYADLSPVVGSEQGGVRPVLVVQNICNTALLLLTPSAVFIPFSRISI